MMGAAAILYSDSAVGWNFSPHHGNQTHSDANQPPIQCVLGGSFSGSKLARA